MVSTIQWIKKNKSSMQSTAECFKKVKSDCLKFIKSQETSKEKFSNKDKMLKSFLIPVCFWIAKKAFFAIQKHTGIRKDFSILSLLLNFSFEVSCDLINFRQSLLTFLKHSAVDCIELLFFLIHWMVETIKLSYLFNIFNFNFIDTS